MDSVLNSREVVTGRFAPSPSGRMHLGNVMTALLSWLSVRSRGGRWILRIEDLDPQRSRAEYARMIEDDLRWLGLYWDEGGLTSMGANGPYCQSMRGDLYASALERLAAMGMTYGCSCTRADILASQAPHASDGRRVYTGRCRPEGMPRRVELTDLGEAAVRLYVPDVDITFTDEVRGPQCVNLAREFGDFVLRRRDGGWAYQLAVAVDDALMGVTEVVRGADLLYSSAPQIYLMRLLRLREPVYAHVPLVCNADGVRLSKRDGAASMESIRRRMRPEEVIGLLAHAAGLRPDDAPVSAVDLAAGFRWTDVKKDANPKTAALS